MVMIFPTPAASMYAVEMDVLDGLDVARLYHDRLAQTKQHSYKLLKAYLGVVVLQEKRIERKLEAEINVVQAGFRQGRGTRDHIFNLRMIIQKCCEFNQPLFTCFMDYTKAFDSVEHQQLWTVMREMGFPKRIVSLIEALYSEQQSAVRTDSGTTDWFSVSKGVRQGCIMSPQLFSVYTESIMREVEEEQNNSEYDELSVGGTKITELRYADNNNNKFICIAPYI